MIVVDRKNRLLFSNNIDQKKIKKDSMNSPIGKGLLGKKVGEFA